MVGGCSWAILPVDARWRPRALTLRSLHTQLATVRELRASSSDRSRRKGDLKVDELNADGRQTLLDVGITYPLIDTYITNKSTVERGFAANKLESTAIARTRTTTPSSRPRTSTCTTSRSPSAPLAHLAPVPGASSPRLATRLRTRRQSTTTTRGTRLARSATLCYP